LTLIDIYDELKEKGIKYYSGRYGFGNDVDAATIEIRGCYGIFFDVTQLKTERQEMHTAVHELSHIETGAMVSIDATPWEVYKAEQKATRHEIKRMIPFAELRAVTQSEECRNNYEIAEHFNVPEELVEQAIEYYHNHGERW